MSQGARETGRQGGRETGRQGDREIEQNPLVVGDGVDASCLPVSLSPCPLVFLIGSRGSGKTTVARLLAERLGWEWLDADAELEARYGRSIREVFAAEGEDGFRRREADILADLGQRERTVIATGGGVVLREDNRRILKRGKVVWLTTDADTLWRRVSADPSTAERRPSLTANHGDRSEIEQVLRHREPLYRACADLIVDTTTRSPEEVATFLLSSLTLVPGPLPR